MQWHVYGGYSGAHPGSDADRDAATHSNPDAHGDTSADRDAGSHADTNPVDRHDVVHLSVGFGLK
jgi:hypothetical protein